MHDITTNTMSICILVFIFLQNKTGPRRPLPSTYAAAQRPPRGYRRTRPRSGRLGATDLRGRGRVVAWRDGLLFNQPPATVMH